MKYGRAALAALPWVLVLGQRSSIKILQRRVKLYEGYAVYCQTYHGYE